MDASELRNGFEVGGRLMTYTHLHRMFLLSPPGKALAGKTRFLCFKAPGIPEVEWRKALGVEADRTGHLMETWRIGKIS